MSTQLWTVSPDGNRIRKEGKYHPMIALSHIKKAKFNAVISSRCNCEIVLRRKFPRYISSHITSFLGASDYVFPREHCCRCGNRPKNIAVNTESIDNIRSPGVLLCDNPKCHSWFNRIKIGPAAIYRYTDSFFWEALYCFGWNIYSIRINSLMYRMGLAFKYDEYITRSIPDNLSEYLNDLWWKSHSP